MKLRHELFGPDPYDVRRERRLMDEEDGEAERRFREEQAIDGYRDSELVDYARERIADVAYAAEPPSLTKWQRDIDEGRL